MVGRCFWKFTPRWAVYLGLCAAVCAVIGGAAETGADESLSLEYEVKAAFLFNFTKFVEWPPKVFPDANAPFIIGVLGEDPFGDALEKTLSGQVVKGRRVEIRRSRRPEELQNCHILFISQSEGEAIAGILDSLKGKSILTISDAEAFAGSGGIIGFIKQENKIRFEINTEAAAKAHLEISSKLLALSRIVSPAKEGGQHAYHS